METIRFDDFIRLNRGFDLPDYKIEKGEYPVITSTNIKAFHKEYKVEGPMVVTGRSGSLGKVQYIEGRCWPLNTSLYVKDYKGNFPRYVYYFLQMMHLEQYNAGVGVPTLNQNHLHSLKIKIHEKKLQQKIASILSAYDRLIENNTRRIRLLEQMAENLYKEWFVRFRFPEHENVEMVNGLPKRWKVKRYEEELNIRYGKGLSTEQLKEEGYPVFGSNGQIGFYDSYMYEDPQILISCRGASSGIVNISLPKSFITSNSLICERTEKTESLYEYLKYYFLNNNLVQYQTGSAQPQITINNIVKLKLLVPELKVQRSFSEKIRVIDMEIYNLQSQIQLLTRQRDLLLPRLMSGKLEVKS